MSQPSPSLFRVALVDDHTFMREGLKLLIESLDGFAFAWMAESAAKAMRLVESDAPDVLLVDISLPDRGGLDLVKDLHVLRPDLLMLVISMHDENLYAQRALRAGARGYLSKDSPHSEYERVLRRVVTGGVGVTDAMSERILMNFAGGSGLSQVGELDALSDRELEVFHLLGEGKSTTELAHSLGISPKTVDVHKMNIKTKLRLEDGAAVTRRAIQWTESQRRGVQ